MLCRTMLIGCVCCLVSPAAALADASDDQPAKPSERRIELAKGTECASIVVAASEAKGVLRAAEDLQRDLTKITGLTPNIVHRLDDCGEKCIVVGSADCPEGKALLATVGLATDDLDGKWECFKYRVLNPSDSKDSDGKSSTNKTQVLAIAGSNLRGTIFGIYDFEQKHLGVDPFWFWADHEPPCRAELILDEQVDFGPSREPTWKYRGWTLNDHPQLIEWMETGLVKRARYGRYMFSIHPEVFDRLWEAALRLKMNMFTWYFVDVDWQPDRERLQAAVDRGLFVTQHQMEGVGADSGYWDHYWAQHNPSGKPKEFSYRLHPEAFREFWTYYIRRWAEFSPHVVWELNLRGWADGPYTEPSLPEEGTPQQRAELISRAVAEQAQLVRQYDTNPDLEMMTTLYAEVGRFYDEGWIRVPENVTTGFSDAAMNGMSWSKRFWTEKRNPKRKYGQYFHTQYFGGGPQIAKCTNIEKYIKVNMDGMYQRGDTQHMLLAVNEVRHQQTEIRAIAEMLWDYANFEPREYMLRYCRDEFGDDVAADVLALYDAYYEKYPHVMRDDGFKKYSSYYKVMEPLFTVIANLNSIANGNRDGVVVNYQYNREIYEQGIRDLGQVLDDARRLRPSIPEDRRYFFDYEFIDAIRLIRGIYRLSIAVNDACECLKNGNRPGALAALRAARPLTDELYAAFRNNRATEKWKYWYRSGTNEDFYLMFNLYQKSLLKLETESMEFVTDIVPRRRPLMGNPVMHQYTTIGDMVYGVQTDRINGSVFNGANDSFVALPLEKAFQIRGMAGTYRKWDTFKADQGQAYAFTLEGKATVYVATRNKKELPWLDERGFTDTGKTLEIGHWGWPYRYRNRPARYATRYAIFTRQFPAGRVELGANADKGNPYIVFVQPSTLVFDNFHGAAIGNPPPGWNVTPGGGAVTVVDNPDYDAEMRPTVFDISTVPRYVPLDLKSLRLQVDDPKQPGPKAELELSDASAGEDDFVVDVRLKPGQREGTVRLELVDADHQPVVGVTLDDGTITCTTKEKPQKVAGYHARCWHNLKLHVSPKASQFSVTVEDDQLNTTTAENLGFASSTKPITRLRLTLSADDRPGRYVDIDAVSAYRR